MSGLKPRLTPSPTQGLKPRLTPSPTQGLKPRLTSLLKHGEQASLSSSNDLETPPPHMGRIQIRREQV